MTQARDLARLSGLAQLVLDHRLAAVRLAAEALDQSRAQLQALDAPTEDIGLSPVETVPVALAYQRWADVRRSELNLVIARQTGASIEARGAASLALGRSQVLQKLVERGGGSG
jgi:hypothetical protein